MPKRSPLPYKQRLAVGQRIAAIRAAHGDKQGDLAKACRVSQVAVSKWERGMNLPSGPARELLCTRYEVRHENLFRELAEVA